MFVMANAGSQAPGNPNVVVRTLHHPHVHLGANAISVLMGVGLGVWIYYAFWMSDGVPVGMTVAWVIVIYLVIEPITAALTIIRKDGWFRAILDQLIGVALIVEVALIFYDHVNLALTGQRAEVASVMALVTVGAFVSGILITLIVNTRILGGVPITGGQN
jgi:hypothetical protein